MSYHLRSRFTSTDIINGEMFFESRVLDEYWLDVVKPEGTPDFEYGKIHITRHVSKTKKYVVNTCREISYLDPIFHQTKSSNSYQHTSKHSSHVH